MGFGACGFRASVFFLSRVLGFLDRVEGAGFQGLRVWSFGFLAALTDTENMYVCMYVCMYACMHVCMHVCARMYVCMYTYIAADFAYRNNVLRPLVYSLGYKLCQSIQPTFPETQFHVITIA